MMQLSKRERIYLTVGGGFVGAVLLYLLIISPFFSGISRAEQQIQQGKRDLQTIIGLYKSYTNIQAEFNDLEQRIKNNADFSVLAALEELAAEAGIRDNIDSMQEKPRPDNNYFQESAVEVKLKKVDLKQLMNYMYKIEESPNLLRVRHLIVETRYDDRDVLNARIEVSTFKPL